MMTDLLPCPFCGGKNLLTTTNEFGGFCLTCANCDAVGPPSEYDPQQMRDAWNTRADHVNELIAAALGQCGLLDEATFDARAALAARDKRVREEALREAAKVVHDDWGWDETGSAEKAILALI
jgi:Lar family restriction alleviation protein